MYSLQPLYLIINLTNSTGTTFIFNESVDVGNKLIGNINIELTCRQRWNIALILRYKCKFLYSSVKTISKLFSLFISFISQ